MSLVAEKSQQLPTARSAASGSAISLPLVVTALLATALLLRVWQLGNLPGVNADEAWSGVQANRLIRGEAIAWRTPTGNPVNVFFLGPLVLLHTLFTPSFALLRSVAVVSGIAAIAVNYALCRRVFDAPTATVSTVLLALLPINIAYSRFAWDASQSLLFTLPVMYWSLAWYQNSRRSHVPWAALAALAAAVIVHPTNVFAAPLVVVPLLLVNRDRLVSVLRGTRAPARPASLVCLMFAGLLGAYLAWTLLAATIHRVHGPAEIVPFLAGYLKLFSGATVYEFIAGTQQAPGVLAWLPMVCNAAFGLVTLVAGYGWYRRLAVGAPSVDIYLLLGWTAMMLGFMVVAGASAIAPHFERYGLCLVAPGALVLARGLAWWIEPERADARPATWLLACFAWLLPLTFWLGYFISIETTGGLSHRAFRTARVEPKQAALEWILARRDARVPCEIVASEWWLYWPLEYLAGQNNLQVRDASGAIDPLAPERARLPDRWLVEFVDSPAEQRSLQQFAREGQLIERQVELDYAERPLISVIRRGNSPAAK